VNTVGGGKQMPSIAYILNRSRQRRPPARTGNKVKAFHTNGCYPEMAGKLVKRKLVDKKESLLIKMNPFKRKPCKYWSVCRHRDDESPTCKSYLEASGYCGTCKALDDRSKAPWNIWS